MRNRYAPKTVVKPQCREELSHQHGMVWDTVELAKEFIITAIIDELLVVRRKSDNSVGTLMYQHAPRYYYRFIPQAGE